MQVSLDVGEDDFSDPDGDELTFTAAVSREDVYVLTGTRWHRFQGRAYFMAKDACDLAALTPVPANPFDTVITVTATDPLGATAVATMTFRTEWECSPVPKLETAAVDAATGKTLTLTFNKDLAPPGAEAQHGLRHAFVVQGAYHQGAPVRNQSPTGVAIDGATVTLSLGAAIPRGAEATVGYDQSAAVALGTPLQDGDGTRVESFTAAAARAAAGAPLLTTAQVAGTVLTLTFNRALDEGSQPAGKRFRVTVDGAGEAIERTGTASVSGKRVRVRLASAVEPGEAYGPRPQLHYRGGGANPLRAASSGPLAPGIVGAWVTVIEDNGAPGLVSAFAAGTKVTLIYDEALDESSVPAASAFTVTGRMVNGVSVSGSAVTLALNTAPAAGAKLTYTVPTGDGANPIRDLAGTDASAIPGPGQALTAAATGAPALAATGAASAGMYVLTLTFDKALDPESVLSPSAFSFSDVWRTVSRVAVRGKTAALVMTDAVYPCYQGDVVVSYAAPDDGALQNLRGAAAASFSEQTVTNAVADDCVDGLDGGPTGSVILVGTRPFDTSEPPQAAWFTVSASGGPVTVTGAAFDPDDAHLLVLEVSREFTPDETITASYRRPPGERGLWNVDGKQLRNALDLPIENRTGRAPAATGVAVTSDAGSDATYALGEKVRVTVTFSEAVDVDTAGGTPHLTIDLDPADWGAKAAAYESGSGTKALVFAHEVVEPNVSTGGVAVVADTLALNGGTIRSAAGADAALAHEGLDHDPAHKVDWRLSPAAPSVTGVEVTSDAGSDDTYALGERVRVTVTFGEAVEVDTSGGTPHLTVDLDPADWGAKRAAYESGGGTAELVFAHEVVEPNLSTAGVAVLADTLALNGGTVRSAATEMDADLSHDGLGHDPAHKVDWRLAPAAPSVTGVAVTSDAGPDGVYTEGETVEAAVTFSAPVTVGTDGGTPTLALIADGRILRAPWASGSGTARLVFAWTVTEAEGSVSAVRVAASGLKLDGGTVAGANDTAALLGFGAAPAVTSASLADEPDGRWEAGDAVEAVLAFAEPVTVTGAPSVGLVMEGAVKRAVYAGGSGTDALTFRYTAGDGDGPWTRAALAGDSLALGGGTILSAGGGLAVPLAHAVASRTLAPVDRPPSVIGVAVVSDAGDDATYALGETVEVRVMFGEAVEVDTSGGTPRLAIDLDPADWGRKGAAYAGGSGTESLTFVHTVVEPNLSTAGVAVLADTLALGGGTIRSAATQMDAELSHDGLGHDPAHKVDWRLAPPAAEAPTVTGVAIVSDPGAGGIYGLGAVIRLEVTFGEAVAVDSSGGVPTLTIDMDPADWGAKRAAYAGGSGSRALAFSHVVVKPNYSTQGIAVIANTLALNGGAIRSVAGGADARLAHAGLDHDPGHRVDWRPALSVADAEGREGVDPAVEFAVRLSRAASGVVKVDYATADGTGDGAAKAGEDYTATSGTLVFAAGEREKTVAVPILDDGHDEGRETFLFRLSNASNARIADGEATGTILNTDKMPKAWLARFGRTVAEQVVESVQARLEAPRVAGGQAVLGGQTLPSWAPGQTPGADAANPGSEAGAGYGTGGAVAAAGFGGDAAARRDVERLAGTGERDDKARAESRSMTGREVLAATAFSLTTAPEDGGPSAALWGRGASSSFSGRDGALNLDGEVTSAALGADWRSGRWLLGAMVKRSVGEGSYSGDGGAGSVESTLTEVYPYAAVDLSARLRAWAAAGLGEGTLTLTPQSPATGADDPALETGISLGMGALGAKGRLVEPSGGSGLRLDVEADGLWVRTSSEKAPGLAAAQADVTRLRLGLDGGYAFALEGGGTLEPRFELGLRHDGGDAETGWGVDIDGGVRWNDSALGLSAEIAGRGLLAHEAAGFKDRGVSGSLAWDPDPASDRGPSLTLTQTLGAQAAGGADALLGRETLADLAANDNGFESRRLEATLGYGLPAFGGRLTATPELGLGLADTGREWRLGWRLGPARSGPASFELGLAATRTEPAGGDAAPEQAIRLNLKARF